MPSMRDSTDAIMAAAIEHASVVIAFVSRRYKESANCAMEFKYSNKRFKQNKLKIIYVMMQQDYTTVSDPDCCDGYLGVAIGDALWYPMWNETQVASTVAAIQKVVGSNAVRSNDVSTVPSLATATATKMIAAVATNSISTVLIETSSPNPKLPQKLRETVASSADVTTEVKSIITSKEKLYEEAWKILNDPKRILKDKQAELSSYLDELGVFEGMELLVCTEQELKTLSEMLKPAQSRVFDDLIKKIKTS